MTAPALCQTHPEAAAQLGLFAIFAQCQANKAAQAQARQAKADARLARGGFWWQKNDSPTQPHD
jgi:hypothetical protein